MGDDTMIISKVFNNNVVLSKNDKEQEIVVMGSGIAFQKKAGDVIQEEKIEKIFLMDSGKNHQHMESALESTSMEFFKLAEAIVKIATQKYQLELHESVALYLADHLQFAIQRYHNGINVKNVLLTEIKRLYPTEFQIGTEALDLIYEQLEVLFPIDEAGYIAFHLVNAQLNMPDIVKMTNMIQEILNIIKYHYQMDFNENSFKFQRLITHLKFFSQRIVIGDNDGAYDDELYGIISEKYPRAFLCAKKIRTYIMKNYQYEVKNSELVYLTIHIHGIAFEN